MSIPISESKTSAVRCLTPGIVSRRATVSCSVSRCQSMAALTQAIAPSRGSIWLRYSVSRNRWWNEQDSHIVSASWSRLVGSRPQANSTTAAPSRCQALKTSDVARAATPRISVTTNER